MLVEKALIILLQVCFWLVEVASCRRKSNLPKYCLPCTYKGPYIEVVSPKTVSLITIVIIVFDVWTSSKTNL